MDLTQVVKNVVLTKVTSFKADADSTESKTVTLKVKFEGVTLNDVFAKAMAGTVIQWTNGQGRKNYDNWIDKQTVNIDFKAPAIVPVVDPETAMVAKLQSMNPKEQGEYLLQMIEKAKISK